MLELHYAGEDQYLEVNQRAGPRLCLAGPIQLHLDPTRHESIHVRDAILVNANEALVIYGSGAAGPPRGLPTRMRKNRSHSLRGGSSVGCYMVQPGISQMPNQMSSVIDIWISVMLTERQGIAMYQPGMCRNQTNGSTSFRGMAQTRTTRQPR